MKVDAVFAGGGIKAFAFIGALQAMEESGYEFARVAGTSAGSMIAALIKAGYTGQELDALFDKLDLEMFKDERFPLLPTSIARWFFLYFRLGLYRGDQLEKWLCEMLAKKGVHTFSDLPYQSLRIIASDLSRGRMLVLPDDLKDYGFDAGKFSVAKAVRMSCSIPFYFEPVKLYDRIHPGKPSKIVDGGVLSNFPMWLFNDELTRSKRPVIGFQLKPDIENANIYPIDDAFTMFKALFATMSSAHDARYIRKIHAKHVVFIPVQHIKATDFSLTGEQKEELIQLGKAETEAFLKHWPT